MASFNKKTIILFLIDEEDFKRCDLFEWRRNNAWKHWRNWSERYTGNFLFSGRQHDISKSFFCSRIRKRRNFKAGAIFYLNASVVAEILTLLAIWQQNGR
jgi:hypothetical protein